MTTQEKEIYIRDKEDADRFAKLLNESHNKPLFNNFIGVALSSYMNGINDAFKSFDAVKELNRDISQ